MSFSRFAARAAATTVATGVVLAGGVAAVPSANAWEVAVWDRVAQCESSGNWQINTGNGYYGGLQFYQPTWRGYGGQQFAAYAHQASKAEQIAVARRVLAAQGPGAWPVCSKRAGLTRSNGGADRNAMPGGGSSTAPAPAPAPSKPAPAPSRPAPSGDLTVDGVLGKNTTRALQKWVGTTTDGVWGPATTRALQRKVGARVDGVRGPETIRKMQAAIGARQDGRLSAETVRALQRYLNAHVV